MIFTLSIIIIFCFQEEIKYNQIKVAFYCFSIKYGGVERVISLLLNLLYKEKDFIFYLITNQGKLEGEYNIPNNINRIYLMDNNINLFQAVRREKMDILIYNTYGKKDIEKLNKIKKTKVICYNHSSFLIWIYQGYYSFENSIYKIYQKCKYVISLIPFENDYLFKKWGINSILMDNPLTFEYDSVIPSDLSKNNIIKIGRIENIKRFDIGIKSMINIIKEIPDCKMYLLSSVDKELDELIKSLNLEKYVIFTEYQKNIEPYLKNASLHIFPSIADSYGMVLSETKIFWIPTILCGLDYLALAKGGTIIIYDDNPATVAKEAIKILKNETYRKKLGVEARKSMEKKKMFLLLKDGKNFFYQ